MAVLAGRRVEEGDAERALETSRHGFGELKGKKLSLHLLEAAYLVGIEKLAVEKKGKGSPGKGLGEKELVALAARHDGLAKEKYALLKEFRSKGHCVRFVEGEPWLRVYEKGKRYGEAPSLYLVRAVQGKERAGASELAKEADMAHKVRKKLVLALAGKNRLSFYKVERTRF